MNKTNRFGVPEEELVLHLYTDELMYAKPLIDFIRDLNRRIPLIGAGIEEATPADQFCLQVIRSLSHPGTGTHVALPDDVEAFFKLVGSIQLWANTRFCKPVTASTPWQTWKKWW